MKDSDLDSGECGSVQAREVDGDALRLAVKLGVVIGTYANFSTVDLLSPNQRIETVTVWHHETGGDPYAATRLAINRAAAEVAKATGAAK